MNKKSTLNITHLEKEKALLEKKILTEHIKKIVSSEKIIQQSIKKNNALKTKLHALSTKKKLVSKKQMLLASIAQNKDAIAQEKQHLKKEKTVLTHKIYLNKIAIKTAIEIHKLEKKKTVKAKTRAPRSIQVSNSTILEAHPFNIDVSKPLK